MVLLSCSIIFVSQPSKPFVYIYCYQIFRLTSDEARVHLLQEAREQQQEVVQLEETVRQQQEAMLYQQEAIQQQMEKMASFKSQLEKAADFKSRLAHLIQRLGGPGGYYFVVLLLYIYYLFYNVNYFM